jgi:hypothetical protein
VSSPGTVAWVRQAIYDWFAPPNVAGLNFIYLGTVPRVENPSDYVKVGEASSAFGIATVANRHEHRKAFGAPGKKRIVYECGLLVICRSVEPLAEDAIRFHDALMDACVDRLHGSTAGRTLGGRVFSAGEGAELGLDDVEVQFDMPKLSKQLIEIWSVMRFAATEWIDA